MASKLATMPELAWSHQGLAHSTLRVAAGEEAGMEDVEGGEEKVEKTTRGRKSSNHEHRGSML